MSDPLHDPQTGDLPQPGDVLAGKYRVERVIGAGGMGVVVAALHLQLQERVALKFLLPTMTTPEALARFGREARAAAKIKSEHVARVTDVGTLESGAPYMVMEYLEGKDLGAVLAEQGRLPVRDAVEYLLQACEAVAEAHTLGIVHRDLKPSNLFLAQRSGRTPRVKVLDFGISKLRAREPSLPPEDPSMTRTRAWLGSPLYMSPEQMRSARDVDARADVWALGVILFELLTASVPFDGQTFPELCGQILHGEPTPLEQVRADAPPGLGDVIRRCLEKPTEKRFQNVGELVLALVPFAPRRVLPVAERAVSVMEAAGWMPTDVPRLALDGTLPEPVVSPFRDSVPGQVSSLSQPPPIEPRGDRTSAVHAAPASQTAPVSFAATAPTPEDRAPPSVRAADGTVRAALLVAGVLVLLAGGTAYYLRTRASGAEVDGPAASSAPAASTVTALSATDAPAASVSATPIVTVASATPTASAAVATATAVQGTGVATRPAPPETRRDAGAGARPAASPPTPEPQPKVAPAPEGLSSEMCTVTLPDGSKKTEPCR